MMYQGKRENRDLFIPLQTCQQEIGFDNIFFLNEFSINK